MNLIWSNQLSELLELPFSVSTSFSLFLLFLPLIDWSHIIAAEFASETISNMISQMEEKGIKKNQLCEKQEEFLIEKYFISLLIQNFVSGL